MQATNRTVTKPLIPFPNPQPPLSLDWRIIRCRKCLLCWHPSIVLPCDDSSCQLTHTSGTPRMTVNPGPEIQMAHPQHSFPIGFKLQQTKFENRAQNLSPKRKNMAPVPEL
uniref:Uncharacterized protein n=1 Tax=Opuntia streptacantha TaxID=393608 RepID=A0A7C8YH54_OPUST